MDLVLAARLRNDTGFRQKIAKTVRDYATLGFNSLNYWIGEFDVAHDMLHAFAPLTKGDFESLEKGHPRRYVLPMTSTQITTMATFIAQMLYGSDSPHKVEGRGPEDEISAEHINALLKWNAEQQQMYLLGYLWIQDALTFNRGVFYNAWKPIMRPQVEMVLQDHPDEKDETGAATQYWTPRTVNKVVGGFAGAHLVSPYDFFCDPSLPLWRIQEGRFCGHRFKVPWTELKRRSLLDPSHASYILPQSVAELEKKRKATTDQVPTLSGNGGVGNVRPDTMMSRSSFERQRSNSPLATDAANKEDKGTVDCLEIWVRLVPEDHELHDGTEPVIWQFIICNDEVLAANESTYAHGMYPYTIGEGRPSGHYQFAPSWVMMLYGLQSHIDYLKNRHQEAIQRTVGNVFVADPTKVDLEDFLNPDKEGLIIPLKAAAAGQPIRDVIAQIPIKDLTENFTEEWTGFVQFSETVTGVSAAMQGSAGQSDSATEFAGTQQMAAGRMANVARLLSVQGVVPQTKQFVAMFQQFLDEKQVVRYSPDPVGAPPQLRTKSSLTVSADVIQGEYDFVAHDGTLPGTDARKVAAIGRLMETAAVFPQIFAPAPGNIDPRQLVFAGARASGLDPDRFQYDPQTAGQGVQGIVSAQEGIVPAPPVMPPGQLPGPAPAAPQLPDLGPLDLGNAAFPPAVRPGNV